jgi:hypothetical protein
MPNSELDWRSSTKLGIKQCSGPWTRKQFSWAIPRIVSHLLEKVIDFSIEFMCLLVTQNQL